MGQQRVVRLVAMVVASAVVIEIFGWYFPTHYNSTDTGLFAQAMYIGVAAMGLNLLTGYNGQVSLGHGAFFGIGAYTTALLMDHQYEWLGVSFGHMSFIATLPAAPSKAPGKKPSNGSSACCATRSNAPTVRETSPRMP